MKGLIIREPWIGKILSGAKSWEMRTKPAFYRGPVALIRKGDKGMVVGVAEIADSLPPLDAAAFRAARDRHGVPPAMDAEALEASWVYPWVLRNVRAMSRPVPSGQKPGAVTWVKLSAATISTIQENAR